MQIILETKSFATLEAEALVTYVFDDNDGPQGRAAELDQFSGGLLSRLNKSGELTGKPLETTLIHAPANLKATRLLLLGAGKRDQFTSATLRKLAGVALRYLKSRSVHNFAFLLREGGATENNAQALVEGFLTADFETDKYKTDKKKDKYIDTVVIAGYSDTEKAAAEKGITRGRIIGEAQNFARDLINEPSNKLTPRVLAEKAEVMAKDAGLKVEVFDDHDTAVSLNVPLTLTCQCRRGEHS